MSLDSVIDISVIIPIYNSIKWLDECLNSILKQKFNGIFEVSIFDDGSSDGSSDKILEWIPRFTKLNIKVIFNRSATSKGPGFARNQAILNSNGKVLCFVDADDIIDENRLQLQYSTARLFADTIVGSQFSRFPKESTIRYTNWANSLTRSQLYAQAYTSHGPTIILPTWMCSRLVYERVGGFDETGKGTPEDLIFFYKHLYLGGKLHRIDLPLVVYRYHLENTSLCILEESIWQLRVAAIQQTVLSKWNQFTIWSAGKLGKRLYRTLSEENQQKVIAFCDVDEKKISKGFYVYEQSSLTSKPHIPIVHFSLAQPPFIICVKQDLTNGLFEKNLAALQIKELLDYIHFG